LIDTLTHAVNEFVHSPVEVLGALAAIAGAASPAFKAGRLFWLNLWALVRSKPIVPSESLRIVQSMNDSYWSDAKRGDKPLMHVVFRGHATDISGHPNRILRAELPKPLTHSDMVLICDGHDCRRPQVVSPNESTDISTSFFVDAPTPTKGLPWRSSVVFIDQYNNRHKIKNCVFSSIMSGDPPLPKEPEEFPYEIADPIEKEVVAVLKAELNRYGVCGRSCGGLGSVHIAYQGRHFPGVGTDSWTPNSPQNQLLVADPSAASLESDNLEALAGFYRQLSSDEERARFENALLDRLNATRGYLAVAYFVLAALLKVGALSPALRKAKRDLPENETRFFGLSNVLMLLNGLLKFRYPDFSNEMLDDIERMIHGLSEHAFLIPARLAAIRASRLQGC
jgi:hypothetical protein